ncbi:shikimate dehydrogenase [Psychrobacter ciconiae]|uniref:shikimate dehydrogenase n=1 Tax=Psychrobacter ciconiae TaxID=1553449 RepID=UPI00191AA827|nr:shikimate dehydrogenase [Psychrobacter ciconiae]
MTAHFMVIGNPIAHSKSPMIHQAFANQAGLDIRYARQLCPTDEASFIAVIEAFFNGGGIGANVTVPFKQMAFDYCQKNGELSNNAAAAGAVNTLYYKNEVLIGDNTDGQGLVNHMLSMDWQLTGANIAIIGAGGAARGVILPLIDAGVASITLANRTLVKAQDLIADLRENNATIKAADIQSCETSALTGDFDIIINATSIGLTGDKLPLSDGLTCSKAYDMMYGKSLPFLSHFENKGAVTSDGFGMLLGQAALSFLLWTGFAADVNKAKTALQDPALGDRFWR